MERKQQKYRTMLNPESSQIMLHLACLLIPQGIFLQSPVITDTGLLQKFPRETNILHNIRAYS